MNTKQGCLPTKRERREESLWRKTQEARGNDAFLKSKYQQIDIKSSSNPNKINSFIRRKTDPTFTKERQTLFTQFSFKNPISHTFSFNPISVETAKQIRKEQFFIVNLFKHFETKKFKYKCNYFLDQGHLSIKEENMKSKTMQGLNKHQYRLDEIKSQLHKEKTIKNRNELYLSRKSYSRREQLKHRMKILSNSSNSPIVT